MWGFSLLFLQYPKPFCNFIWPWGEMYCRYMILHEYSNAGSIEWNLRRKCHAITPLCNQCFQPVHVIISLLIVMWERWIQQLDVSLGVMLIVKKGQTMADVNVHYSATLTSFTVSILEQTGWLSWHGHHTWLIIVKGRPTCSICFILYRSTGNLVCHPQWSRDTTMADPLEETYDHWTQSRCFLSVPSLCDTWWSDYEVIKTNKYTGTVASQLD